MSFLSVVAFTYGVRERDVYLSAAIRIIVGG